MLQIDTLIIRKAQGTMTSNKCIKQTVQLCLHVNKKQITKHIDIS